MLGSEYNWLLRFTRLANGAPKIALTRNAFLTLAVALFCFLCFAIQALAAETGLPDPAPVVINIKDCGAIGDGQVHLVREWIQQGRYRNARELRRALPAIQNAEWSVDEAAFECAKSKLPPGGGTIYFPAGRYVAAHGSWTIERDHVRLLGDGADQSILLTVDKIDDALVLSPYRHVGWLAKAAQQFPFEADSGGMGTDGVMLRDKEWSSDFQPDDLVFIRNGACRFDQDYGEFNEVSSIDENGYLRFRHPLSRDYTFARLNWAGTVTADFELPKPGREVTIKVSQQPGNFEPPAGEAISIGDQLFEVVSRGPGSLRLRNPGRANAAPGTQILANTRIAKSRAIIKVTRTTRDFRAEKLRFVGHRKTLNLSNSYGMAFSDCRFVRDPGSRPETQGGLTIDGDGGRWARFTRCTIEANPPWPMQFARSFGGVVFDSCIFEDANVAFTEFSFDCEVTNSTFNFHGPSPDAVVIVGKSGGGFRITNNRIHAENVRTIFDAQMDIQSQKHPGEGTLVIHDNTVVVIGKTQLFRLDSNRPSDIRSNPVIAQ